MRLLILFLVLYSCRNGNTNYDEGKRNFKESTPYSIPINQCNRNSIFDYLNCSEISYIDTDEFNSNDSSFISCKIIDTLAPSLINATIEHSVYYSDLEYYDDNQYVRIWVSTHRFQNGVFLEFYNLGRVSSGRLFDGGVTDHIGFYFDFNNGIYLGLHKENFDVDEFSENNLKTVFFLNTQLVPEYYVSLMDENHYGKTGVYKILNFPNLKNGYSQFYSSELKIKDSFDPKEFLGILDSTDKLKKFIKSISQYEINDHKTPKFLGSEYMDGKGDLPIWMD